MNELVLVSDKIIASSLMLTLVFGFAHACSEPFTMANRVLGFLAAISVTTLITTLLCKIWT